MEVYEAFAKALVKRNIIDNEKVTLADASALNSMAEGTGVEPEAVQVLLGGKSLFTADHGYEIGWKPRFPAQHLLKVVDEEVQLILDGHESM